MKRIYFLFFLMILFWTSISWAAVDYDEANLRGFLAADDNPIVRVLNSDGTHRATSKATLRAQITAECTIWAGSYGTLDMAITGSIRRGNTAVDSVAGAQNHLIGAGPFFPTSVAETRYATAHNSRPGYKTSQTSTYVLNGKATFTRSGSGGINLVEYLGVAVGVSDSTTYTSQIGQQIDSVTVTRTTQTLSDSVSGNACRSMVINSSGSVSFDEGCDGNGNCPPREWNGSLQRRHGRCGGDFCNCNSGSSDSSSTTPPSDDTPSCSGCTSHCSSPCSCSNSGTCNGTVVDDTPNCQDCTSHCSSPCSCTNSGTCNGTVVDNTPNCSGCTSHCSSPCSCGSGTCNGTVVDNTPNCSSCTNGCSACPTVCTACNTQYNSNNTYSVNLHRLRECRFSGCGNSWHACSISGWSPPCNNPYRKSNGWNCGAK